MGNALSSLSIENKLLSFDDQFKAGFYSPDGWDAEPVTKALEVDGHVIGQLFPEPIASMCLTAFWEEKPIGHCNANKWLGFLTKISENIAALSSNTHPGVQTFLKLVAAVVAAEETELKAFFVEKGLDLDQVFHNCGLMILASHGQKGIGTQLVAESDTLLVKLGAKANVVEASNYKSRRAFEKNGYTVFKSFRLADYGVSTKDAKGEGDTYCVLYKIF